MAEDLEFETYSPEQIAAIGSSLSDGKSERAKALKKLQIELHYVAHRCKYGTSDPYECDSDACIRIPVDLKSRKLYDSEGIYEPGEYLDSVDPEKSAKENLNYMLSQAKYFGGPYANQFLVGAREYAIKQGIDVSPYIYQVYAHGIAEGIEEQLEYARESANLQSLENTLSFVRRDADRLSVDLMERIDRIRTDLVNGGFQKNREAQEATCKQFEAELEKIRAEVSINTQQARLHAANIKDTSESLQSKEGKGEEREAQRLLNRFLKFIGVN